MEETKFAVFNQKMAGWLMMQGFILRKLGQNYKLEGKNVFYFTKSEEIRQKIEEYQKIKHTL